MKKLFKLGFLSLLLSSLIVMSGCYKSDIDSLEKDVNELRKDLADEVLAFRGEIQRVEGLITILDNAITAQITQLQADINPNDPNSVLSKAIAAGNLATLNSAKAYAEQLRDALQLQINPVKNFLMLNASGEFVVNEAAPNDMLNGNYATLGQFVTAMTAHLSSLKGLIQQNTEDIAALAITVEANSNAIIRIDEEILHIYDLLGDLEAVLGADGNIADALDEIFGRIDDIEDDVENILETIIPGIEQDITEIKAAIGTMGAFWGDFTGSTVWEAIGHNYAKTLAIYNRLDNLNGDPRTLESFVEDVDQFILDTEAELTSIQERFAGFADGETIADFVADAILAKVGSLTPTDGSAYDTVTEMVNGEIAKLNTSLTNKINDDISGLRTELTEYVDDNIAALRTELLGVMQDMVTGIAVMKGKDGAIVYDDVLKYPVVTQVVNNVFGPDSENELEFVAGNIFMANGPHKQSMLIKVTPDNAVLTAATKFVLFDTQKKDYLANGAYEIEVVPYTGGVLTRSEVENHGLWVVTLTMKDQDALPIQGALLSMGIVNNMVPEAATDRVVSTGPVVEVVTSVAPYTPAYFYNNIPVLTNYIPVYNVKIGTGSARDIHEFTNSGNSSWWNRTPPSVNATTGAYNAGSASNGDDRPIVTQLNLRPLRLANVGDDIAVAPKATVPSGLLAWYVDFKSAIPSLTTVADWGHINVMRTTEVAFEDKEVSDIATPAVIKVPANNALHREVVEFNVMGVNIDGTMVDPDGVPFRVGIVAPNYTAPTTQLTVQLEDYGKGDAGMKFNTDAIEFSVADLGFTEEFMSGLTTTYDILLPAANHLRYDDLGIGVMQVKIGENWLDVKTGVTIAWKDVTHIRFTNVDPCALASGAIYTGNLVLTETVATTAPGVESNPPYVTATQAPAIKLTFPISIKLGSNMPFGTDMMNYKTGMASNNNIVIWPSTTGTYGLGDAFQYLGTTLAADVTFTPEDADLTVTATPHILTIANVVNHLSKPTDSHKCNVLATYAYGPVFGTAYGNGYFQQPWAGGVDGVFTVEARNRMDWVTYDDSDITTGLPTATTTLDASKFKFTPVEDSGMGSESFTLKQAVAEGWVLNPITSGATIETIVKGSTVPADVNKYFNIAFNAVGDIIVSSNGSTSVTETIELNLNFMIYDQFGEPHNCTRTLILRP